LGPSFLTLVTKDDGIKSYGKGVTICSGPIA
jgi:hypothetical protein